MAAIRLDFVICPSFHGASLLSLLLSRHSKIAALGDTIPQNGSKHYCACRATIEDCPFWQRVDAHFNTDGPQDPDWILPIRPRISGSARADALAQRVLERVSLRMHRLDLWRLAGRGPRRYAELYLEFYLLVRKLLGVSRVVDGQKELSKVLILREWLGDAAEIRVIHLLRDPRGFHVSAGKRHQGIDRKKSARGWQRFHTRAARLADPGFGVRYLALRYEDLCALPDGTLRKVFEFLDVEPEDVLRPKPLSRPPHIVGNRMLLEPEAEIVPDLAWRERLSDFAQREILAQAAPLAPHYGYRELGWLQPY